MSEYVYAAMIIYKVGGKIDEETVTKVLEAVGIKPDLARVKALVASCDGLDIDKVIKEASNVQVAPTELKEEEKKEEKPKAKEEEKKDPATGLDLLFG